MTFPDRRKIVTRYYTIERSILWNCLSIIIWSTVRNI